MVYPVQLLSLNCLVLGDNKVFTVKVPNTDNVSEIKKENPHAFDHVDAKDLDVSQVSLRVDDNLVKTLKSISLVPLKPLEPLSKLFPSVEKTQLHVIVQAPTTGEPFQSFYSSQSPMSCSGFGCRGRREERSSRRFEQKYVFEYSIPSLINIRRVSKCHLAYFERGSSR